MLIGLEFVEDKKTRVFSPRSRLAFWAKCFEKGLFSDRDGIIPPLIITMEEADRLCDIVVEALKDVEATLEQVDEKPSSVHLPL